MANSLVLNKEMQLSLTAYLRSVLDAKRQFTTFEDKLISVDIAYACYKAVQKKDIAPVNGIDLQQRLPTLNADIPVVASQVDSVVAYLTEVFLSGSPMFPVVGNSDSIELADQFETLIDFHANKGRYVRQLQMLFRDGAKYNFCGIETKWDKMAAFSASLTSIFGESGSDESEYHTAIRRLDPYNTIWDYRVDPADVSIKGEYAGFIELMSRTQFKALLNGYSKARVHMNVKLAMDSSIAVHEGKNSSQMMGMPITYRMKPQINQYVLSEAFLTGGTYMDWLSLDDNASAPSVYPSTGDQYEVATIYARIIPSDHKIPAPKANHPVVWKFQLVNEQTLIYAEPVDTPHGRLPIILGQPVEDGFSYQTRGVGEAQIPFQVAASQLYATRVASAKRAISDRGIYDSDLISMADINSTVPAAKIPARNLGMGKSVRDAYLPIPFDDRSTINVMGDLRQTLDMSNMLFGINPFRQGQPIKGNRTLGEFQTIDDSSSLRSRLLALMMETQIFMPLKDSIKLNILTHKGSLSAVNHNTGQSFTVDPAQFTDAILEFKMADGYTPKSKLASTQQLQLMFQTLQNIPMLQSGFDMTGMFAHLMNLAGVKNLDQYRVSADDKNRIMADAMPYLNEMISIAQSNTPPEAQPQ